MESDSSPSAAVEKCAPHVPPPAEFTTVSSPPNSPTARPIRPSIQAEIGDVRCQERPPARLVHVLGDSLDLFLRTRHQSDRRAGLREGPSDTLPIPRPPPVINATLSLSKNGLDVLTSPPLLRPR